MLICTIPSSMYVRNADGVNETLQAAAAIITASMNRLSTDGVVVRDVGNDGEVPKRNFCQHENIFFFQINVIDQQGNSTPVLHHELQRRLEIFDSNLQLYPPAVQREGQASPILTCMAKAHGS